MKLSISGRHGSLKDDVRAYAEDKIGRVERYDRAVRHVEVVLDVGTGEHRGKDAVKGEAKAHLGKGAPLVVNAKGRTAEAVVDELHDLLERSLRRHKEKARDRSRARHAAGADVAAAGAGAGAALAGSGEEE